MTAYGTRMAVRTTPRPNTSLYITNANANPRMNSKNTVMTVISIVVPKSVHQTRSERIVR